MFNLFNRKPKAEPAPICNCGNWPDPTWTYDDFIRKNEAIKLCPAHKHMTPVMVVKQVVDAPEAMVPQFDFGKEIRAARVHLINAQQAPFCTKELWDELEGMVASIERIIADQKKVKEI